MAVSRLRAISVTALTATLLAMNPAQASASANDCPDDFVCMWEDSQYGGDMWVRYERGTINLDKFEIDGWDGDNEISSIVNNTDIYLIIFEDDNWNGANKCYNPNTSVPTMGSWNDDAESFVLHTDCTI
jgi:hypothetical protein